MIGKLFSVFFFFFNLLTSASVGTHTELFSAKFAGQG